jgi:hypothetical protein
LQGEPSQIEDIWDLGNAYSWCNMKSGTLLIWPPVVFRETTVCHDERVPYNNVSLTQLTCSVEVVEILNRQLALL